MESLVILVHVLAAIGITGLVPIQHGKGADMGASFGSGASGTIFGSVGSGNALTKSTAWLATVFFITSLVLALYAKQQAGQAIAEESLIQNLDVLNEVPAAASDVPAVGNVSSDVPQTGTDTAALQEESQAEQDAVAPEATEASEATDEPAADAAPAEEPAEAPAQ